MSLDSALPQSADSSPATRSQWLTGFVQATGAEAFTYLLLDSRHLPVKERTRCLKETPSERQASLWDGTSFQVHAELAPRLIQLHEGAAALKALTWLLDKPEVPHWAFSLFRSTQPFHAVTAHMAVFKDYAAQGQRKEFVLHLADSRVLARLPRAFQPERWQAFLAPFAAMAYLDRQGQPVHSEGPDQGVFALPPSERILSLTATEHQALIDLAYPDKLTALLRTQHGDALQDLDYPPLYATVLEGLDRARSHKLAHEADLEAFVKARIFLSPTFDEHPAAQDALKNMQAPGDFATAFRGLPGDVLQAMSQHT